MDETRHQSVLATMWHRVRVTEKAAGIWVDPTPAVVQMAFTTPGVAPLVGDWKTGSWETDITTTPASYIARILVGPLGAVTLVAGQYDVWVQVNASPETVVIKSPQQLYLY